MSNSGKKNRVLRDKKTNILTVVLSEKKILNEKKTISPCKLNGWSQHVVEKLVRSNKNTDNYLWLKNMQHIYFTKNRFKVFINWKYK